MTQIPPATGSEGFQTAGELLPLLYTQLRVLAAQKLSQERPGQTLQPTALVHEAWLRLTRDTGQQWQDRRQFFMAAAEAMRRILVENARRKHSPKHGGHLERMDVAHAQVAGPLPDDQLLAVDAALERLAAMNPRAAAVVKLRFFAGLSEAEVAEQLEVSVTTVERTWAFARVWLFHEIRQDLGASTTSG